MYNQIPTIEQIYNFYHRQTMHQMKGFYPKSIQNYDKCINETNRELLTKFQHFIQKNCSLINWKLYIISLAKYYKRRFDLKLLGSLAGTKIYKQYVQFMNVSVNLTGQQIKNQIVNSLKFLINYVKENKISINDYFREDESLIPTYIKHLNSGSVSKLFYACFNWTKRVRIFFNTPDDVFYQFFNVSRNEFLEILEQQRKNILKFQQIQEIVKKIQQKF